MPKINAPLKEIGDIAQRIRFCDSKIWRNEGCSCAKLAGIRSGTFSKYKSGITPPISTVSAIAEAAKVNFEWLALGIGNPDLVPPDTRLHLDPERYTAIPTIDRNGLTSVESIWGYVSTEQLMDSIQNFRTARLGYFRITENVNGPKFFLNEWLLVDMNQTILETGDFCIKASYGGVYARQLNVNERGEIVLLWPENGRFAETKPQSATDFSTNYSIIGRIVAGAKLTVFDGP